MFIIKKNDNKGGFSTLLAKFRKAAKDLRLQKRVQARAHHERNPSALKRKETAKAREERRAENLRQSYYA